jgi:hypothetical protein
MFGTGYKAVFSKVMGSSTHLKKALPEESFEHGV